MERTDDGDAPQQERTVEGAGSVVVIHFKPGEPVTKTVKLNQVVQFGGVQMQIIQSLGGRRMVVKFEEQA